MKITLILIIILLLLLNGNENFDNNIIYCINLERRENKWDKIKSQADKQNLVIQRYSAIDGRMLQSDKIKRGRMGCFMSHCQLWNNINSYRIIIEDDIIFINNFQQKLNQILLESKKIKWDIILFQGGGWGNQSKNKSVSKHLEKMNGNFYGTYGYIISKQGAEKLIKYCKKKFYTADVFLNNLNRQGEIDVYRTKEKLVKISSFASDTEGIK